MLNKYHKQQHPKERINQLKVINETYGLKRNLKEDLDILKLSIFQTSLSQKKFFEDTFENVRKELFDMWDYLSFYEKNDLILQELDKTIEEKKVFQEDVTLIYIPFFDVLLNSLYATEIAILEKPQFFKLYREFNSSLINTDQYGLKPFKAGFTFAKVISSNENAVVLFDQDINVFYYVYEDTLKRFPLYKETIPTESQINKIAELINSLDEVLLEKFLVENDLVSKKYLKKYNRIQKRIAKKERKANETK